MRLAYHDAVRFAHGPQIDFFVISTGHKHSTRLVSQGKTIDAGTMCHKFLWNDQKIHVRNHATIFFCNEIENVVL